MKHTAESVWAKLQAAHESLQAMKRRDISALRRNKAYWPDVVSEKMDYANESTTVNRQRGLITMGLEGIVEISGWLDLLSPEFRGIISWRLESRPLSYAKIGYLNGYSRDTARRRHATGLVALARLLNSNLTAIK